MHRHMSMGKPFVQAILDGSKEIALPAFVSTLCICIVFVPMFFLTGVARYLFVPLAEAVVFAMMASYFISRTLVPTLIAWFYKNVPHHAPEDAAHGGQGQGAPGKKPFLLARPFVAFQRGFERAFASFHAGYQRLLGAVLQQRVAFVILFLAMAAGSLALVPQLGQDFFPQVDAGQMKLHLRARSGTRIEETARLVDAVEQVIRKEIPSHEIAGILDNIGIPNSGISLSYSNNGLYGTGDADVLVSLKHGHQPQRSMCAVCACA